MNVYLNTINNCYCYKNMLVGFIENHFFGYWDATLNYQVHSGVSITIAVGVDNLVPLDTLSTILGYL